MQPPFFAGRVIAVSPDTAGGVDVNTNAGAQRVRRVIPRLYAVGNMVGGFKGR
ncbi:MAG: FAD-binding protein [Eggerthella lenta]